MALPRRALGSCATLLRQRSTAAVRTGYARHSLQTIRTRGYASGGHEAKKSSDLPWLFGAIAVTAPILWYIGIYTPDPNAHHEDHGSESHEESKEDESESDAKSESKDDSSSEGGEDTPASSDDEGEKGDKDDAQVNKTAGSQNTTSGKQEGLSNADTKHSTAAEDETSKSPKPEGGAESAKAKGTVKVEREPAEKTQKKEN